MRNVQASRKRDDQLKAANRSTAARVKDLEDRIEKAEIRLGHLEADKANQPAKTSG